MNVCICRLQASGQSATGQRTRSTSRSRILRHHLFGRPSLRPRRHRSSESSGPCPSNLQLCSERTAQPTAAPHRLRGRSQITPTNLISRQLSKAAAGTPFRHPSRQIISFIEKLEVNSWECSAIRDKINEIKFSTAAENINEKVERSIQNSSALKGNTVSILKTPSPAVKSNEIGERDKSRLKLA